MMPSGEGRGKFEGCQYFIYRQVTFSCLMSFERLVCLIDYTF